ncbi:MAG: hypothetical protein JSW68_02055 [Burkholderiales bacterium]|nr:MAG: hypothetical protein JSW68_02055 [Burkholderiales bacterium]
MGAALIVLKGLVEFGGMLLLGRFAVHLLSFGRHEANPIYRLFCWLTAPLVRVARWVAPKMVEDRHLPLVAFLLLFWIWVAIILFGGPLILQSRGGVLG